MRFSAVMLVLLLLSLLSVVDQAATFVVNVTQSSYEAVKNHNITLEWIFTSRTQGSYRDLFIYCSLLAPHREQVLYQVHGGVEFPDSQDEQFSGRVQSDKVVLREGRIRFHVSRLRTEDSGLYRCEVKTEDGVGSAECRLNILDQYELVGHEPIHAKVGDNVILPCHLKPPLDVSDHTIEWRFKGQKIYVHRSQKRDDAMSNPEYKTRTSLFHKNLTHGDISLSLTNLVKEDEGNYICFVPKLESRIMKGNVTLKVDENGAKGNLTVPGGGNGENNKGRKIDPFVGIQVCIIIIIISIISIAGLYYWRRKLHQRDLNKGGGKQRKIPEPLAAHFIMSMAGTRRTTFNKTKGEMMQIAEIKATEEILPEGEPLQDMGQPNQSG